MHSRRGLLTLALGLSIVAQGTTSPISFLATDGNKLFRADSTGATFGSVTMSAEIQSLTRLPSGVSLPGALPGDVIACAVNATSGRYKIYRLDDPFGAGILNEIGSLAQGVGSLTFANGEMFGIEDSVNPVRVVKFDPLTGNTLTNYNTGLAIGGSGGLAFNSADSQFYFTDSINHRLYRWAPGGTATLVGPIGVNFSNNGLEFHDGILYGALRRDSPANTMGLGFYNLGTGAFTTQATLTGILGNGTGFLAVPEPGSMAALLIGAGVLLRRRRRA